MKTFDRVVLVVLVLGLWALVLKPSDLIAHSDGHVHYGIHADESHVHHGIHAEVFHDHSCFVTGSTANCQ